jgi:hypothetical protein
MGYMDEYKFWLESDCFDEKTKEELRSIADDDKEIQDRFYKNLKFGTGGMRGIMGAGTNRMNIYTVTKATQGLAEYILEVGPEAAKRGVVIAHDCRNMSAEFTEASALCLNANGIKTYVFDALRPTPELSFAVRELGCIAGIVVTASHNPPEYNGYKVYWEDGSQIVSPQDQDILKHVADVERYEDVKTMDKDKAVADGLFCMVPASVDENYYQALIKQTIHGDIIPKVADDIKIVYTPLHGTGNVPVREVLKRLGFKHVYVVEEQTVPDGDFSTVKSPNPERFVKVYNYNADEFEKAEEKILDSPLECTGFVKNTFYGSVDVKNPGILYIAYPYNDGFKIYVDGEPAEKIRLGRGNMGVRIYAGSHDIEIAYRTPGLMAGALVSLFGICIMLFMLRWDSKQKHVITPLPTP